MAKTGTPDALRASSAGSRALPLVSAPSLTTTSPARGTPASCWRAWSSAAASRVLVPEKVRSCAGGRRRQPAREAERPHREALGQGPAQAAVGGAELLLHVGAARLPVHVGDAHAARVVEQHADHVLVRHGGAQHQHRPEQADQQQADQRGAQGREDHAVAPGQPARRPLIGDRGHGDGAEPRQGREPCAGRGGEAQFPLVEDDPANAEEELGQPVEHSTNRQGSPAQPSVRIL